MICYMCKQDLDESKFSPGLLKYKSPSHHICRPCNSIRIKEYRNKNPNKVRQYDATYAARAKDKRTARLSITCAINYRGFERKPCQVCGTMDGVQGHHPSYLEKDLLTVVWLCPVCHKGTHYGRVDISGLETYTAPPVVGRWG